MQALCKELSERRTTAPIETLYVGGGTPTLLSEEQWARLSHVIHQNYDLSHLREATVEVNPEQLTPHYASLLTQQNLFNRLSIGVQSTHDVELRMLNRIHSAHQAVAAVEVALRNGFRNLSVDLIYGLPCSTVESWRASLTQILSLPITHLSCYALTRESGTMLDHLLLTDALHLPDEETTMEQYEALLEACEHEGFTQYEISSFCKPGHQSIHNSHYWDHTPYIGCGAGAHSFNGHSRRWNVSNNRAYTEGLLQRKPYFETEQLNNTDLHNEYLMTALRTCRGIEKKRLNPLFASQTANKIKKFITAGLVIETPTHYQPTHQGLLQADGIAAALFE